MRDSTKRIVALALWLTFAAGAMTLFCGGLPPRDGTKNGEDHAAMSTVVQDHGDAGLRALQESKLDKAEREFARAGDDVRLAETFIRQGRLDEAELLVRDRKDGQSRLMLALVYRERGDRGGYVRLLTESAEAGNAAAESLLQSGA